MPIAVTNVDIAVFTNSHIYWITKLRVRRRATVPRETRRAVSGDRSDHPSDRVNSPDSVAGSLREIEIPSAINCRTLCTTDICACGWSTVPLGVLTAYACPAIGVPVASGGENLQICALVEPNTRSPFGMSAGLRGRP